MSHSKSNVSKGTLTKEADHIYYDILIPHNDAITVNGSPTPAIYSETRSEAIVEKASDYYLAIDRFSIPGLQIPIFIFTPQAYYVSMDYLGANLTTQEVLYIPFNNFAVSADPLNPYWWIYTYQSFIKMINNALDLCFTALPVKPAGATAAPYLVFNEATGTITFIAQQAFSPDSVISSTSAPNSTNNLRVFFNTPLFNFFQNFYIYFGGYTANSGNTAFQILITNSYNNSITIPVGSPGAGTLAFTNEQEFNTLAFWNSFKNIVITSGSLPVRNELIPTISQTAGQVVQGTNNFRRILSDFIPVINNGPDARSNFQYFATGKYRYLDLVSDSSIFTVDLQFFWEDNYQNLIPLTIPAHDNISIKFAFIKRNKLGNLTTD